MGLVDKFIKSLQSEGLTTTLSYTYTHIIHNINPFSKKNKLRYLRFQHGNTIIRDVNGSEMELELKQPTPNSFSIQNNLAINPIREEGLTNVLKNVLEELKESEQQSIHVFDLGANIGYYSLLEAKILRDTDNIYAVEPDPRATKCLKKNIKLNRYDQIDPIQIGVGEERKTSELLLASSTNANRASDAEYGEKKFVDKVELDVHTLDQLIKEKKIPENELIFIRMDVAGYEKQILSGMRKLLNSDKRVYVAINVGRKGQNYNPLKKLEKSGFVAEYISKDGGHTIESAGTFEELNKELGGSSAYIIAHRLNE